MSLRVISPWGLADIVFGVVLVVVGLVQADRFAPAALLGLVPLFSAAILLYALWFTLASTSIWFTKIYNATEVLRGLLDAGRYPMAAYPAAYRFFFTFIVPVAFVTTVPAEALLQRSASTTSSVPPAGRTRNQAFPDAAPASRPRHWHRMDSRRGDAPRPEEDVWTPTI